MSEANGHPLPGSRVDGDSPGFADGLFEIVHDELRDLAASIHRRGAGARTLQATALVNETWLKLEGRLGGVQDRQHFLALAALAMRQVLADYARSKLREKRGGGRQRFTISVEAEAGTDREFDAIEFHDALDRLSELNERHARVAELRLLGSLRVPEIAELLGVSEPTVKRDWQVARLWLARELRAS